MAKRVEWTPALETDMRMIDQDHKGLVDAINYLGELVEHDAGTDAVADVMATLNRYVDAHFNREERVLFEYGYPDFEGHKKRHNNFRTMILALRKVHGVIPYLLDLEKLQDFLCDWLTNHIAKSDLEYVPYVKTGALHREAGTEAAPEATETLRSMTKHEVDILATKSELIGKAAKILNMASEEVIELQNKIDYLSEKLLVNMNYEKI